MTQEKTVIKQKIFVMIQSLLDKPENQVDGESPLIGSGSLLNSMKLVELCLKLEDLASSLGFEFDWTSDAAMSKSRGMFRTADTLATEFLTQMDSKK